jgi:hypothetical protein
MLKIIVMFIATRSHQKDTELYQLKNILLYIEYNI